MSVLDSFSLQEKDADKEKAAADRWLRPADRANEWLERHEQERQAEREKLRAGRPDGLLAHSLCDWLRSQNIAQLEEIKRLCNSLVARQRKPPSPWDCHNRFAAKVIASFGFKDRLYRVELKRTTKRATKIYVNGPYVYAYHWDGAYVRPEYFGSKNLSKKLPRRVWTALKDQMAGPEIKKIKSELAAQLSREVVEEHNSNEESVELEEVGLAPTSASAASHESTKH
jgi:hypothetical protein